MKLLRLITLVLAVSYLGFGQSAFRKIDRPLFSLSEQPRVVTDLDRTSTASVREAAIEFDAKAVSSAASLERIVIPTFDDVAYTADRTGVEVRSLEDVTWRGKIRAGKFAGDVVLTFRQGYAAGLIYTPGAVYEITNSGGRQILMELDQSRFPECAGDVQGDGPVYSMQPEASLDSGDRIDVLVVYTPATKAILGGDAQAQVLAQQAIDVSNTSYINSKISQRVRLVHAEEYNYTETSSASADLSALRNNAGVAALRNTYKADLVAMIGEIQGACGIGYLMGSVGGNPNNGYTFTGRSCAVGNLSFPHELGHNMGSAHNPENGSGATYSYGYGHWIDGSYRTVMSYSNPCTSGCTRAPYFSNPNVMFNSVPTGIADARDNSRSINLTDDVIANYRYSGSSLMLTSFLGPDHLSSYFRSGLTWTSDNITGNIRVEVSRDEGITWETLIANTPNNGFAVVFNTGAQTPRGRLRVTSIDDPAVTDSSNVNVSFR